MTQDRCSEADTLLISSSTSLVTTSPPSVISRSQLAAVSCSGSGGGEDTGQAAIHLADAGPPAAAAYIMSFGDENTWLT